MFATYGFQYVAAVAAGTQFAFALMAALIMLIAWKSIWKRLGGYGQQYFPSWIKSERWIEGSAESSPLRSSEDSGEFNIFQPPSASRSTGALNQNRANYGTVD